MKININDTSKIEAALEAVNGQSTAHTYTQARQLELEARHAEGLLQELGIPKGSRKGAVYVATSGGSVPNAYRYARQATSITLTRGTNEWFLTGVESVRIWRTAPKPVLTLSQDQAAEARRRFEDRFEVGD